MLNLVVGKPGSGKSYYMVRRLYCDYILTQAQVEPVNRRHIYTNLPLNLVEFNKTLSLDGIKNYDSFEYVHFLEKEFFGTDKFCWWEQFPTGALIIIDEVQYYLSAREGNDKASNEYLKRWEEYVSTHRHRQQDLFFLTQHPDNIQKSVLNMAEGCYHIINIKSKVIPYLGIPIADIDQVRQSFGSNAQYALVKYGIYIGRAFKAESTSSLLLENKYFRLYQSHFSGDSDRPKLNLSRFGAVLWFLRRHLWHLALKGVLCYVVIMGLFRLVVCLPAVILSKSGMKQPTKKINVVEKSDVPAVQSPIKISSQKKIILRTPNYRIFEDGTKEFINTGSVPVADKLQPVGTGSGAASSGID